MARRMVRLVFGTVAILTLVNSGTANAAKWADALFSERAHDFGPVPRGAKVKHNFTLTNRLGEPITILDLRPSCGCTSGKASASVVNPGESAAIEAQMDTRNFLGMKSTILYVTLVTASGRQAEVRLGVTSNILADVVLNPGSIDFGTVRKGQSPSLTLTIDRINAPNWKFEKLIMANKMLTAKLVETNRDATGAVSYALTVGIKADAPAGVIRDEIRLMSNDRETSNLPIMVTAVVQGDLTAAPSILSMGEVDPANGKQGRFILKASRPFTITQVEGAGDGFSILPAEQASKNMHVLTVAFKPQETTDRGDLRRILRVHTDLPDETPIDLTTTLHVNP